MDKIDIAIERLKQAEMMSHTYYEQPLIITYSGGKDSDCILELAKISGIDFEVQHSHTTADAPETIRYIRERFYQLELDGIKVSIDKPYYKGKRTSMWDLIPQKKMPPTRLMRYCCSVLKENSGRNRVIATGIRWDESNNRRTRGVYEDINTNKDKRIVLKDDESNKHRLFERCEIKSKIVCNPIIDWLDNEVWDFLKEQKCQGNPLYSCGFNRVGCIGCPMASRKRYMEFARYPKYKQMYISAFDRMLEARKASGKESDWQTGQEVFDWWMGEDYHQLKMDFSELEEN